MRMRSNNNAIIIVSISILSSLFACKNESYKKDAEKTVNLLDTYAIADSVTKLFEQNFSTQIDTILYSGRCSQSYKLKAYSDDLIDFMKSTGTMVNGSICVNHKSVDKNGWQLINACSQIERSNYYFVLRCSHKGDVISDDCRFTRYSNETYHLKSCMESPQVIIFE